MAALMFIYSIVPAVLICGTNLNMLFALTRFLAEPGGETLKKSNAMYKFGGYCSILIYVLLLAINRVGGVIMVDKIAVAMHVFAIIYLVAGILAGVALIIGAFAHVDKDVIPYVKGVFRQCLSFAVTLWIIAWLIS